MPEIDESEREFVVKRRDDVMELAGWLHEVRRLGEDISPTLRVKAMSAMRVANLLERELKDLLYQIDLNNAHD